ncbi:Rap1a/Tai family immunity protein [Marivita sp. XM-24bin2]|uniref:Rap1a/Tai family immunity protein n=1 Tax=Marivita sp. XM-24bin2 TaxID=2133951 RepID=UPI003427DB74
MHVCLPLGVERGQMIDVVIKYLDANPAQRHNPARMLTWLALLEAFPCDYIKTRNTSGARLR